MTTTLLTRLAGPDADPSSRGDAADVAADIASRIEERLGVSAAIVDGVSGEPLHVPEQLTRQDWSLRGELCREVARRHRPEPFAEDDLLLVMGIPLGPVGETSLVAVATVLSRRVNDEEDIRRIAKTLEIADDDAHGCAAQTPWPKELFECASEQMIRSAGLTRLVDKLERDIESLSDQLLSTYEEISLLYRLAHSLQITSTVEELARMTLDWLREVVPARGLAVRLIPPEDDSRRTAESLTEALLITNGECPCDDAVFAELIDFLGLGAGRSSKVANRSITSAANWPYAGIEELVVVPLAEGDNLFGWLAAFNHTRDGEFGTAEANLLSSVGSILGIHSGNIELYRQQADLVTGIVRALTSAIDAKDPYTCGHSDRVARIAVRLAQELGCSDEQIRTLYLGGLLHDVGKIGVDDHVLRKPGKLTEAEYEHIKMHANIGYNILVDLKRIAPVLPIVRHHHESWDGRGYPHQLAGENIPLLARIAAVADAFDAMASDRPYRRGMDDEKVDEVFRRGAGIQWDAAVVEAFFRARQEVGVIVRGSQAEQVVPTSQWT